MNVIPIRANGSRTVTLDGEVARVTQRWPGGGTQNHPRAFGLRSYCHRHGYCHARASFAVSDPSLCYTRYIACSMERDREGVHREPGLQAWFAAPVLAEAA